MDVPELSDGLIDTLVAQSDEQAAGRSIRELEQARDDCLVAIIQGLRAQGEGAGAVLADYERGLLAATPDDEVGVHVARVRPEWVDYNGHMHESRYLQLFGDATDALLRHLGVDVSQGSYFTVETHLSHLREATADEQVQVTTQLLDHDGSGCTSSTSSAATTCCWPPQSSCSCTSTRARGGPRPLRLSCWRGWARSPAPRPICHGRTASAARSGWRDEHRPAAHDRARLRARRAPARCARLRRERGDPRELVERAAALGLTCYDLPAEYGGGGVESLVDQLRVIEELTWGDSPIALCISQGGFFAGRCSRSAAPSSASAGCRRCAARPRRPPRWPPPSPRPDPTPPRSRPPLAASTAATCSTVTRSSSATRRSPTPAWCSPPSPPEPARRASPPSSSSAATPAS